MDRYRSCRTSCGESLRCYWRALVDWRWELAVGVAPLVLWLAWFKASGLWPHAHRPPPNTSLLPRVELALFGGRLFHERFVPGSETSLPVALLAALPYFCHFALVWLFAVFLFATGRRPMAFTWLAGWCSFVAVVTHFIFPTAPVWYYDKHGMQPADFSLRGDAAGLRVVDAAIGHDFFQTLYAASPVVFGAFPSVHVMHPFVIAVYYHSLPDRHAALRVFFWLYFVLIAWAAMFLHHHYLLDVVGGVVYVLVGRLVFPPLLTRVLQKMGLRWEEHHTLLSPPPPASVYNV